MVDAAQSPDNSQLSGSDSEENLIEKARGALSNCNWIVGECAAQWTDKYARGRTDADFGSLINLSGDQVFQRRRVWETFHDVRHEYPSLKWSHFYVAINWDDSAECLQWAVENKATIAEMRAWRRAIHGEDLTTAPDEFSMQALDYGHSPVRAPAEGVLAGGYSDDVPFESNSEGNRASANMAEAAPYSPFRKDARGPAFEGEEAGSPVAVRPADGDFSPLKVVKRAIGGLRRIQQQLAELSNEDYNQLTPELVNQLWDVYEELGQEIKHQG